MRRAITTSVITARFDFSLSRFAGSIFLWGMVMNRKYFTIFIIVAVFLTVGLALLLIPDNKQSRHGSDSA
jgi:predicted neutral ceramidase superfamily lipid hydrolase